MSYRQRPDDDALAQQPLVYGSRPGQAESDEIGAGGNGLEPELLELASSLARPERSSCALCDELPVIERGHRRGEREAV